MEAVGKHDFEGRNPKEMSFKKGSILKILTNKGENKEWLRAELDGREGLVPANYVSMKPHEWYHGRISRVEAENLVKEQKHDGAFLVRESESTPGEFSISVKFLQGVQHFKIMRDTSGRFFLWLVKFSSLNQLVSYHRTASVGRVQQLPLGNPVPIPQKRPKVVALWDFHPKKEGMLQFRKGDVISLLDKTTHHDWWRGEKDGVKGIFPKTYVGETK